MKISLTAWLLGLLLITASCTRYQYISFSSNLSNDPDGAYFFDNDSVKITYRFLNDGFIEVEVVNKLQQLIYVDWEKSSFIFNEESLPYQSNEQFFRGSSSAWKILDDFEVADFSGKVYSSPNRSYIPPNAKIYKIFEKVPIDYTHLAYQSYEKIYPQNGSTAKRYTYTANDSLHFYSSYMYFVHEENQQPMIVRNHFWVSEIVETIDGMLPMGAHQLKRSKSTGAGTAIGIVGLSAVLIIVAIQSQEKEIE